ncbi:MAG: hypothetical protein C0412_07710 [Flavobacterium sp.]|nr:hypothetical protein [Flavobacterium sp.]
MKTILFLSAILFFSSNCSYSQQEHKGSYLGQKPPGTKPEIFAEGIISLGTHELDIAISPKGDELFYVKSVPQYTIMQVKCVNSIWQAPAVASFSGVDNDLSPRYSVDGSKLFFSSNRSVNSKNDFNIWYIEKTDGKWSEPKNIGEPVNSSFHEMGATAAENGNLYFQYFTNNGLKSDIYLSRFLNGKYQKPEKLSAGINSENNEASPYISPDESFIMFHSDRPTGNIRMDLYISFADKKGSWGTPITLGPAVNSPTKSEGGAYLTPDKKYLFFSTFEGPGKGYIYWVEGKIIEELRKMEKK